MFLDIQLNHLNEQFYIPHKVFSVLLNVFLIYYYHYLCNITLKHLICFSV